MAKEYTVSDSKTGKPEHYQDQDVIETSVNTDGRNQYDWESRYPENARKESKYYFPQPGHILINIPWQSVSEN